MKKIALIFVLFVLSFSQLCFSQKRNEIGIKGGIDYYLGELNPGNQFRNNHLTLGAFYRRNVGDRISLRMSANFATLSGNDTLKNVFGETVGLYSRKGEFKSNIVDLTAMCEINFLNYFIGASKNFWTPYAIVGIGGTYQLSLKGSFVGENEKNQYSIDRSGIYYQDSMCMKKPTNMTLNTCFGFGFKYSISYRLGIFVEWVMHKTFIDWLDGFYWNHNIVKEENKDYAHICNTATRDWYSFLELGLSFAFNFSSKNNCDEHLRK